MNKREIFTGFNTKYALTTGISKHEMEYCGNGMAIVRKSTRYFLRDDGAAMVSNSIEYFLHGEGKEWHRTFESAVKRAEEMRIAKLKSLDKSIKKVSALDFSKEPEMK